MNGKRKLGKAKCVLMRSVEKTGRESKKINEIRETVFTQAKQKQHFTLPLIQYTTQLNTYSCVVRSCMCFKKGKGRVRHRDEKINKQYS